MYKFHYIGTNTMSHGILLIHPVSFTKWALIVIQAICLYKTCTYILYVHAYLCVCVCVCVHAWLCTYVCTYIRTYANLCVRSVHCICSTVWQALGTQFIHFLNHISDHLTRVLCKSLSCVSHHIRLVKTFDKYTFCIYIYTYICMYIHTYKTIPTFHIHNCMHLYVTG